MHSAEPVAQRDVEVTGPVRAKNQMGHTLRER